MSSEIGHKEADQLVQTSQRTINTAIKAAGKKALKAIGTKALIALKPIIIPAICILLLLLIMTTFVMAVVYGGMPAYTDLDGDGRIEKDEAIKQAYVELADKYNVLETWLGTHRIGELVDRDGKDKQLINNWGLIHGYLLLKALYDERSSIPEGAAEKLADDLKPTFRYRETTTYIKSCHLVADEDGNLSCECDYWTEDYYLLTEAETIKGHYKYRYEYYTIPLNDCGGGYIKEERLASDGGIDTIGSVWARLDRYISQDWNTTNRPNIALLRKLILETETPFTKETYGDWLMDLYNEGTIEYTSLFAVPHNLRQIFEDAGQAYGINSWILAALAYMESGFNPGAPDTEDRQGIYRMPPHIWQQFGVDADGNGEVDINNPRDATYTAANYLRHLMAVAAKRGFTGEQQLLTAIKLFRLGEDAELLDSASTYADTVLKLAKDWEEQKNRPLATAGDYYFPVAGSYRVSSEFGPRKIGGYHHGIDFACSVGTELVAVISGTLKHMGIDSDGYGRYLILYGDDGMAHVYAHLSAIVVPDGTRVNAGDLIALSGGRKGDPGAGRSTGPHLHYEVRNMPGNSTSHAVNPKAYYASLGIRFPF